MLISKTPYTIENLKVLKNGKLQAQGLGDMESALHCVFVLEGKKENTFFVEINGEVFLQEELKS